MSEDPLYGVWIIDPEFPEEKNCWMHDMNAMCFVSIGPCNDHDWTGTKEQAEQWAANGNTPKANTKGWRLEVRPYKVITHKNNSSID